jgi:hypothetical protein
MTYVLIGGTAVGTVLTLAILPALYAIWFRVKFVRRLVPMVIKPALPASSSDAPALTLERHRA